MKFGVEVPHTVKKALELDKKNGNTFWTDAIKKELNGIKVAFNILGKDDAVPPGYSEITCHLIFDVKYDFTRRYVATNVYDICKHVSQESVHITFVIVALNRLDNLLGDIGNAYLNGPQKRKSSF